MKILNHSNILGLEKFYRRTFMNAISGYRSGTLIGTKSENGQTNLAVFNSLIHVGATPPHLGFMMRPTTIERHTYENIKKTGFYTINHITSSIHKNAHQSSAKFPRNVSEFEACGLTEEYLEDFHAPFVKESVIKLGMSFAEEHFIKSNNTIFVVGKVEYIAIDENIVQEDGFIDMEKADGVTIVGLDAYYSGQQLGRYAYFRPGDKITPILS